MKRTLMVCLLSFTILDPAFADIKDKFRRAYQDGKVKNQFLQV